MAINLVLIYHEAYNNGFFFSRRKQANLMYLVQKYSFECFKYFDSSHKAA